MDFGHPPPSGVFLGEDVDSSSSPGRTRTGRRARGDPAGSPTAAQVLSAPSGSGRHTSEPPCEELAVPAPYFHNSSSLQLVAPTQGWDLLAAAPPKVVICSSLRTERCTVGTHVYNLSRRTQAGQRQPVVFFFSPQRSSLVTGEVTQVNQPLLC